jgi:predicted nuclease of restriction endonuclease-like (RecB) superfamily
LVCQPGDTIRWKDEFPEINGLSERNLFYIRRFIIIYSEISLQQLAAVKDLTNTINSLQQVVAVNQTTNDDRSVQQAVRLNPESLLHILTQLPWGHHVLIISKVKETSEAFFYLRQTIEYNWSRAILTLQIEQNLYQRQGKAITNFTTTLSEKQALMAVQMLKEISFSGLHNDFPGISSVPSGISIPH